MPSGKRRSLRGHSFSWQPDLLGEESETAGEVDAPRAPEVAQEGANSPNEPEAPEPPNEPEAPEPPDEADAQQEGLGESANEGKASGEKPGHANVAPVAGSGAEGGAGSRYAELQGAVFEQYPMLRDQWMTGGPPGPR